MTYQTNNDKKVITPSSLLHDSLISGNPLARGTTDFVSNVSFKNSSDLSYLEFEALGSYSFPASTLTLIFSPAVSVHIWRSLKLHSWQSSNWMQWLSSITNLQRLKLCDSHVKSGICLLLPILVRIKNIFISYEAKLNCIF